MDLGTAIAKAQEHLATAGYSKAMYDSHKMDGSSWVLTMKSPAVLVGYTEFTVTMDDKGTLLNLQHEYRRIGA